MFGTFEKKKIIVSIGAHSNMHEKNEKNEKTCAKEHR